MKKLLVPFLVAMLVLPMAFAVSVSSGIGIDITPEEFAPRIWMCDSRVVLDDAVESGRETDVNESMDERIENYAFEGEQIVWDVLVMDKNKIEEITDVVATIGSTQGTGNDIEVECVNQFIPDGTCLLQEPYKSCNARIDEELLKTFDDQTMALYTCTFTVETPASMEGEYFITAEAISVDGSATMDENEYWYLNPGIALAIDGELEFIDVRPGSISYSTTLLVENDADRGSGVLLDMFISGTDFYDPASSGARCPTTNHLKLGLNLRSQAQLGDRDESGETASTPCDIDAWINDDSQLGADNHDHLCYYATNGAYDTFNGDGKQDNADAEGYRPIVYSDVFTTDFYNDAEIIANDALEIGGIDYDAGNVLSPGAEIAINFKLGLPEPCVGDFSDGDIYFWGEAI